MSRSTSDGPIAGAYFLQKFKLAGIAASQADQLIGNLDLPPCILDRITVRVEGTGGLTAFKVRRKILGTRVAVGDTQALSADSGALAANTQATFRPFGTNPTIPDALRRYADTNQIGFFASTDGTVGNRDIEVTVMFHTTGHAYEQSDGTGQDYDTVA